MEILSFLILMAAVALFVTAGSFYASDNLVRNAGFEGPSDPQPEHWSICLSGDWTAEWKVPTSHVVYLSPDEPAGKHALTIDTTVLNPDGEITDELRTWKHPKYEILVTQGVRGIKPNSWYLAKFRIKSPGIAIDEGLQLLADIKPWPAPTARLESFWDGFHWGRRMVEGRLFQPQVPKTDGEYHEYIVLKQTYSQTDTLEVGVRIRAPWTGKITIDEVELTQVDPDKDMSKMEKLLALRAAKPIRKVRELHRETMLIDDARPTAAVLVPADPSYEKLGKQIQAKVAELTGADVPVVTKLSDVPANANIVAVGNMMANELVARLHFNRYVKIDAASPGPGAYVLWSVCEPYGLALEQNVIVVAGSDADGQAAAVDAFCDLLADHSKAKTIELPFLHTVFPARTIEDQDRRAPLTEWGLRPDRWPLAAFSKWYLSRWLETGDLEAVKLARDQLMEVIDSYFDNPYKHTAWDTFEVGRAWDTLEEVPVLSDEDRLKMTNFFLGYLHLRPIITSDWGYMVPRLNNANPTWNHQAKGLSAVYTMGRYFERFYPDEDARFAYYIKAARNVFRQQAKWSKPEENSGNYSRLTMKFAISYYLGEWDMDFFENGAGLRHAEYYPTVCNNKGWTSGFGDTYYCYDGWRAGMGLADYELPLALWYYRDGRMLWWMQHVEPAYRSPYHQDVAPIEWKELVGVRKTPLEDGLFDTRSRLILWGSDGEGAEQPGDGVKFEETFDKVAFRENWDARGQYMLLEGNGRGIHSGKATNQICKLTILGEDLLIGSTYMQNHLRTNCTVIAVKDRDIDDPVVKGNPSTGYRGWKPLRRFYPAYAALEAIADLPAAGFTRSLMRNFLGGTEWSRNIFWAKGEYFAVIDEVTAQQEGAYYVECNFRTCPNEAGRWPTIIPRTGELLPDDRGYEISIATDDKIKHYILTDGTAEVVTDDAPAMDLTSVMVRQVRRGVKLQAGEKVAFVTLMCGDTEGERASYTVQRISLTEALVYRGGKCVGYLGSAQSERTASILPIRAGMFLLAGDTLSLVDGTGAGDYFKNDKPVSREVKVPEGAELLARLAELVEE